MEKAVIVTSEFRDRESFAIVHPVGEVMAVDEARAAELAALGLVKEYGGVDMPASGEEPAAAQPSPKRRRKTA